MPSSSDCCSSSSPSLTHKHHIVPKHAGGSDFAENIVELPVVRHAMWHFAEWQRCGRWQDYRAWKGLSGLDPATNVREEVRKEVARLGGMANKGTKRSKSHKRNIGKAVQKRWESGSMDHLKKDDIWRERLKGIVWTRKTAREMAEKYQVTPSHIRDLTRRLGLR